MFTFRKLNPKSRATCRLASLLTLGTFLFNCTGDPVKNSKDSDLSMQLPKDPRSFSIHRQCDYNLYGVPHRATVFQTPKGNIVQKVIQRQGTSRVVTAETLVHDKQGKPLPQRLNFWEDGSFSMPPALDVEAPQTAECARCTSIQKVADPGQLKPGEILYIPIGKMDDVVNFDQPYAIFRVNEVGTLGRQSPEVKKVVSQFGSTFDWNESGIEEIVYLSGTVSVVKGLTKFRGKTEPSIIPLEEIIPAITYSPLLKGASSGNAASGFTPETFVGWAVQIETRGSQRSETKAYTQSLRIAVPRQKSTKSFNWPKTFVKSNSDKIAENLKSILDSRPARGVSTSDTLPVKPFAKLGAPLYPVNNWMLIPKPSNETLLVPSFFGHVFWHDQSLSTGRYNQFYDHRFELRVETGLIIHRSFGETHRVEIPSPLMDSKQKLKYVQALSKMIEYLSYMEKGQFKDFKYGRSYPEFFHTLNWLKELRAKFMPPNVNQFMIDTLNILEYPEF